MKTKKSLSEDSRQQENSGVLEGTKAERETDKEKDCRKTNISCCPRNNSC